MLIQKYYVIYVRVPSGYPGVMAVELPLMLENKKKCLQDNVMNSYGYALLDILEAR